MKSEQGQCFGALELLSCMKLHSCSKNFGVETRESWSQTTNSFEQMAEKSVNQVARLQTVKLVSLVKDVESLRLQCDGPIPDAVDDGDLPDRINEICELLVRFDA